MLFIYTFTHYVMTLSRSLSNYDTTSRIIMQEDQSNEKIERYLEKKFRISHSFNTKTTYYAALKKFTEFARVRFDHSLDEMLNQIFEKSTDSLNILDEYYTFLSNYKTKTKRNGYSSEATNQYIRVAKDFLNHQGCKIYNEDMKMKFRLPKRVSSYQKGLTREAINRVIRFANPKLATVILIACSSGMRIGEIIQLKTSDVDLDATPAVITIRAETTKTRETRLTHISSEAKNALRDYLARYDSSDGTQNEYLFLREHELEGEGEDAQLSAEEKYFRFVIASKHNLESQLDRCIKKIPELNAKNENQKNWIHFHAFRAWFKTQVTDAHQSDFAEALMGHKSLKLVYYMQNDKVRAKTYADIEYAVTISDSEKIDRDYSDMQRDNSELRGIVDLLSRQLRSLEKKIEITAH